MDEEGRVGKNLQTATTLRRIYDINNRVYTHIYQTTFSQLHKIHFQFENTIGKLQSLKNMLDMFYADSKQKFSTAMSSMAPNTLYYQCAEYMSKNDLSMARLETISKDYYKGILADVSRMLESYMSQVKNFPVAFNGTKLKKTLDDLLSQMNKGPLSPILTKSIDSLKSINQALLSFTEQMYKVVGESRFKQMLKRIPSQASQKANKESKSQQTTPSTLQQPAQELSLNSAASTSKQAENGTTINDATTMNHITNLNKLISVQLGENLKKVEEEDDDDNEDEDSEHKETDESRLSEDISSSNDEEMTSSREEFEHDSTNIGNQSNFSHISNE
jgi:hypothetical protein